jgi:hypothetical protein
MIVLIFFNEGFREQDNRHIINRNRSKNIFNILKPTCMVKFVSLERTKLSKELVVNKTIGPVLISMTKNNRMP